MAAERWLVKPGTSSPLAERDPADTAPFVDKDAAAGDVAADLAQLRDLQARLHVDGSRAVLLVLQGMDTSGKDGTVQHLSGGLSLVDAEMTAFRAPAGDELEHDYLWRVHQRCPALGRIGIFNRSQYEDVLVPRVHRLVPPATWQQRFAQINDFERMLVENGTTVVKCLLQISKRAQKARLQARLDEGKYWKFDPADLKERRHWGRYMTAYDEILQQCSTAAAPWYVIPAERKWFRNYAVTRVLVETLAALPLQIPPSTFDPATIVIE